MCKFWDCIFLLAVVWNPFFHSLNVWFQYPIKHTLESWLLLIIFSQEGKTLTDAGSSIRCASYQTFFPACIWPLSQPVGKSIAVLHLQREDSKTSLKCWTSGPCDYFLLFVASCRRALGSISLRIRCKGPDV